jgi:hypothetical protein
VLFQLLIPGSTPVSLLESKSGFEIVTQLAETGIQPSSHLWSMDFSGKIKIESNKFEMFFSSLFYFIYLLRSPNSVNRGRSR